MDVEVSARRETRRANDVLLVCLADCVARPEEKEEQEEEEWTRLNGRQKYDTYSEDVRCQVARIRELIIALAWLLSFASTQTT